MQRETLSLHLVVVVTPYCTHRRDHSNLNRRDRQIDIWNRKKTARRPKNARLLQAHNNH